MSTRGPRNGSALGATVTRAALEADFHGTLRRLRESEPVTWVPALRGWLVTSRALALEVLRDAGRFTVQDPRFSTGQVLGPSMLSLDGPEQARHRDPFASSLRLGRVRDHFGPTVDRLAREIVEAIAPDGSADLRTALASPLAVGVVAASLDMMDTDPVEMREWYDEIVAAVSAASDGAVGEVEVPAAVSRLEEHVRDAIAAGSEMLSSASEVMTEAEVVSNAAVMLFGGVETSEGTTANAFVHLLSDPEQLAVALADPDLLTRAVDESLRLEPSVVQLDRFATTDVVLGDVCIPGGDFVMVSVAAANRDPETYADPDRFDLSRENARTHLSFAGGPHHCIGLHLARAETRAALSAAFARLPGLRLAGPVTTSGTVFRKAVAVPAEWVV